MGHTHEHHHHHHHHEYSKLNTVFVFGIILNSLYVIIEAIIGYRTNSLGLLSDAGHNLSDVFSLLLTLIAIKLSQVPANRHYTYGYKKSTILISLTNAIILLIAVGVILMESIQKIITPEPTDGHSISITAGIGIIINGITAILLMKSQKKDINVKGAYLHMLADTLVSVGVVVSGIIISQTGHYLIDPIISIIISLIILISTWRLLRESIRLSLDGIPSDTNKDYVRSVISSKNHVKDVHHLHIWGISTTEVALTAHIVVDDILEMENIKHEIKHALHNIGISHTTLEFETEQTHCTNKEC